MLEMQLPIPITNVLFLILITFLLMFVVFMSGCLEKETTYGIGSGGIEKKESWRIP